MRIAGLILLVIAGMLGACSRSAPPEPEAVVPLRTEQGWLARSVAVDLVRLAAFGAGKPLPDPAGVNVARVGNDADFTRLRVSYPSAFGGTASVEMVVRTNVLDPAVYEPLARALGSAYSLSPDAADYRPRSAEALAAFTVEAFHAEDTRISRFLSEHPRSVDANDDAAVLLGAFALRENSGVFWNPLPACARATAHLAFARSLGGRQPPGPDARLAGLLVGLILDTKAVCQTQIDALEKLVPGRADLGPWVTAARFRNTRDWRPAAGPDASLLVRVEKYRALCDAGSTGLGVDYLETAKPPGVVDWARIALEVSWTVEDGHRFTEGLIGGELREAAVGLGRPMPKSEPEWSSLLQALDAPATPAGISDPKGSPRIEVIDDAMWAQNAQRHICHAIYETWRFLAEMWGVPEEAGAFWTQMQGAFGKLELFPAIGLLRSESLAAARPFAARLSPLFKDHPESIPDAVWYRAGDPQLDALFPDIRKTAADWFTPPILPGTAYRFASRDGGLTNFRHPSAEQIATVLRVAPLQQAAVLAGLRVKIVEGAGESAIRDAAGPLLAYCLPVIKYAAKGARSPAFREQLLVSAAKISADDADTLAEFYLRDGRLEQAAAAYQIYVDGASDRVSVSNQCGWLVDYYFDHGQKEKALAIAKMAAEVYSSEGLRTCARLQERMGDLAGAEKNFANIAERYDDQSSLYSFYKRQSATDASLAEKARRIEAPIFPAGIVAAGVADFSGTPARGVRINASSAILQRNGLHVGDIVVAFEGKRVDSFEQYTFLRALSDDPNFKLVVYRDGSYREVSANAPNRRFGVDMTTLR